MSWNAAFPTANTLISQSVNQFQTNWAFINTNINFDHYFNSGNANEGHHRFSQYVNQAGDPVLAADGVVYVKPNAAGAMRPYYKNASSAQQFPTWYADDENMGAPANNFALFNLAALPNTFSGIFTIFQVGGTGNIGTGVVAKDGANISVLQTAVKGNLTAIGQSTSFITISQTVAGASTWRLSLLIMFT